MSSISLLCTAASFQPCNCSQVRWLDWKPDYPLAAAYWQAEGFPLTCEDWEQNRTDGFRYCAIVEQETIAALAAVWMYSNTHWEVAAVSTAPAFRRRGYGSAVVCFATASILSQGHKATLLTQASNVAMLKTAERVGFYRSTERGRESSGAARAGSILSRLVAADGIPEVRRCLSVSNPSPSRSCPDEDQPGGAPGSDIRGPG